MKISNPDRSFASPPPSPVPLTYQNTLVFTGGSNGVWTDFDCGVGQALVLLKIISAGFAGSLYCRKRGTGATLTTARGACATSDIANTEASYLLLPTDASGYLQIRCAGAGAINIYKIAHWKCAMPRTSWSGSVSPTAWTDLNLGVANAICLLRVRTTGANSTVSFRPNGSSDDPGAAAEDLCYAPVGATIDTYLAVLTDADGIVEWTWAAAREYTVTLEAYVYAQDTVSETVVSAVIDAAWTAKATDFGKCILYCKGNGDHASSWAKTRPTGAAEDSQNTMPGVVAMLANTGALATYGLVITNYAGSFDWMQAGGGAHTLTITKLARLA